jgi:hypothetical protein
VLVLVNFGKLKTYALSIHRNANLMHAIYDEAKENAPHDLQKHLSSCQKDTLFLKDV